MWSTIYYTPSGPVELPEPPEGAHSGETHTHGLPPSWLVFPTRIFNTFHIIHIEPDFERNRICITTTDEHSFCVTVTDVQKTWAALQHAFAEGVTNEPRR